MRRKSAKENKTPCTETVFEPVSVEIKSPASAVLLLNLPEEDILVKACEVIRIFAEKGDENKISLLELGALEPLCRLLNHNNRLVRASAFMALGIMSTNGDISRALKKLNAIPSIIEKLALEENTVIHEFATMCLASLSVDFTNRVQIFENNGLPPLIVLLSSPDPDIKKNSLEIIFNLAQKLHQCRQAVHEFGGIPPLLDLLKSEFPVIQRLALKTLQCVTTDKATCITFRNKSGFEKLMDILQNQEFNDLHVEALQVVANCLSDQEGVQQIHVGGRLERLIDLVLTPNNPKIQFSALKCLTRVAQSSESHKVLHEQEAEKVLAELLSVTEASVQTAACQAVAAMSFHPPSQNRFRDLACIPTVVQLLSSESPKLKEAATQALSTLTQNNQPNSLAVYEAGGHEILVQQLDRSCAGAVASSAVTLCNMAGEEVIRSSILSHGAMQALVEPLKSKDPQVLISTTQCVARLARDAEVRTKFRRAGGLQVLVDLLRSNQKKVQHNACFAVNVYASDKPSAVEMCKLGALGMLQEINQSANRNHISDVAITSLLNFNLPVKFSLTGRLTSTDIITGGFYDAGKVCPGQRILTLQELFKEPLNRHRPIIVVGITTRKEKEEVEVDDGTHFEPSSEKPQRMIDDISLKMLVEKAKESIFPVSGEKERYAALGRLVSEAMGGAVAVEKLHEFSWVLHLSELKFQLKSNIVPIGLINKGIYCHRALLFKYLADCLEMSCTLVRGEYNRAWNEVDLCTENPNDQSVFQLHPYIVDLMHEPGTFLQVRTPAALQYQTI